MQEPVYVLHLITCTCHGRIMPGLAELLLLNCCLFVWRMLLIINLITAYNKLTPFQCFIKKFVPVLYDNVFILFFFIYI